MAAAKHESHREVDPNTPAQVAACLLFLSRLLSWGKMNVIGEVGEQRVVEKKLREVASRITADIDLQKDLVQEMLVHLLMVQQDHPGQSTSWYIKSCEFHGRNFLRLGRSIDSYKRAKGRVLGNHSFDTGDGEFFHEQFFHRVDSVESMSEQGGLMGDDIYQLIAPRLSDRQRTIITLLMQGHGVREVARQLGITHPAVIKHRKRVARIAREYLAESASGGIANCGG